MKVSMNAILKCLLAAAISGAIVAMGAVSVRAGKTDSECIHFAGGAGGESIELSNRYTLGGILPLTLCELEPETNYRILVKGSGFERQVGMFSIDGSGVPVVRGIRLSALVRNIVLPGWGSVYSGRSEAGAVDAFGIAGSLFVLGQEELEYRDLRNRLDGLEGRISDANSYADRAGFQAAAHEASREVNIQNRYRERLLILSGALYTWQVLEPFLLANPPRTRTGTKTGEITVEGVKGSRAKALLFSLVKPGSGQLYQGKTKRGQFFSIATLAGGLIALDCQNKYDCAVDDYELNVERFNASDLISEKERLRSEASRLWSGVERERDRRNVSLAVLAGLWAWNLVDASFPAPSEASEPRYSFDLDAQRASIAFRF